MKIPEAKKLPSGTWRCQIMVDGTRYSVTGETKKGAEKKASAMKAGYLECHPRSDNIPLTKAIDGYIAAREDVLSPSTVLGYRKIQRNHFQGLMAVNIHAITKQRLQAAVTSEAARHAPKTVYNAYGLVRSVLAFYGVHVEAVRLPQPKKNRAALSPE